MSNFPEYWKKEWVDLEELSLDPGVTRRTSHENEHIYVKDNEMTSESDENIIMNNLERR